MVLSFVVFMLMFALVGVSSALKSKGTKQDYYLASNSVSPGLVGLSAVATNNSGYMFIGVIGYTYATGLASIWLMIGWILGDFMASLFIHRRLREAADKTSEVSYAGVLTRWNGVRFVFLQRLIGIISLVFLLTYASAQLVAGSKALHVLLGWGQYSGAMLGALLVAVYCASGGIRASIWTDAAQSFVMVLSMGVLMVVAFFQLGGVESAFSKMGEVKGFLDWVPDDLVLPGIAGGALFIISWLFAGFSVIGQPHIMVRFITLNNSRNMFKAKLWYYVWFILFYCMATAVGLLSRIYLPEASSFDAELALPTMAQALLPDVMVGLILAGIFAATMSTADSLVLSCSAAITHDILPHKIEKNMLLKVTTIGITFFALLLAIYSNQSVFQMVIMAWSGLASAFSPLLVMLCLGFRPSEKSSVVAVVCGFLVALGWRWAGLSYAVYEGLPGILAGLSVLWFSVQWEKKTQSGSSGSS